MSAEKAPRVRKEAKISFRLEPEKAAFIDQFAKEERRSPSNVLQCVVSDWIAAQMKAGHVGSVG